MHLRNLLYHLLWQLLNVRHVRHVLHVLHLRHLLHMLDLHLLHMHMLLWEDMRHLGSDGLCHATDGARCLTAEHDVLGVIFALRIRAVPVTRSGIWNWNAKA